MAIPEKDLEKMLARQADRVAKESNERMERYMGALKEDFDSKLQLVLEQTSVIPDIQRTLDATFEEVGKLRVEMEAVKGVIGNHEERIQRLEAK